MQKKLDENAVITAVCNYLEMHGFTIVRQLNTTQRGIDIVARRGEESWHIEAKGETSTKRGSPRFEKGFNANQVIDRVMKGFYTAAAMAESPDRKNARIGLAMPRSPIAGSYVAKVRKAMARLGIAMIWVERDLTVVVVAPADECSQF
jgi:Holliday junction resolvase-like predicted endonuclease